MATEMVDMTALVDMVGLASVEPDDERAVAQESAVPDVAVLAHWLLNRVAVVRGAAAWLASERSMTLAERVWWLERINDAGAEVEHVLGNMARGVPPTMAGMPYVV
jgi:hypothetical protein